MRQRLTGFAVLVAVLMAVAIGLAAVLPNDLVQTFTLVVFFFVLIEMLARRGKEWKRRRQPQRPAMIDAAAILTATAKVNARSRLDAESFAPECSGLDVTPEQMSLFAAHIRTAFAESEHEVDPTSLAMMAVLWGLQTAKDRDKAEA